MAARTIKDKPPWFPFYAQRYLSDEDVLVMTLDQEGAYWRLLATQWVEGSIPADEQRISALLKNCSPGQMKRIWPAVRTKFRPLDDAPGRLVNPGLHEMRERYLTVNAKKSEGAKRRWSDDHHAPAMHMHDISSTQAGIYRETETEQERDIKHSPIRGVSEGDQGLDVRPQGLEVRPPEAAEQQSLKFDFEAVYAKYPRKIGKKKGLQRCRTQVKTRSKFDALTAAVANYAAAVAGKDQEYIKHFDSFMGCWEDWIAPEQQGTAQRGQRRFSNFQGPDPHSDEETHEEKL